ncbi:7723_t:CDS:2, partial [Funneliformis geosporum]
TDRNNYHQKPKSSTIYTPPAVKKFYHLFGYGVRGTYGIDLEESSEANLVTNFFTLTKPRFELDCFNSCKVKKQVILILCNPPFNGYVGFRLNLTTKSQRWQKSIQGTYPPISSIISLPKNIFEGVIFHSEILIFNVKGLKGHYFFNPTSKIEQRTPI